MADCVTEGEHIDLGASSTVAGPVACKIGNVSRSSRKVNRPNRGRGSQTQRLCRYCHSSERPRQARVKDFVAEYGQVIVDECHHLSAFTFEQVMRQVKAKYVVGLTATPERKDGHHPIIFMQCGPTRFKLSARSMTAATPFEHEVVPRLTDFSLTPERDCGGTNAWRCGRRGGKDLLSPLLR